MRSRQQTLAPYFFLAPFVLIFCTFTAYPLFQSILLSMRQTYGPGLARFVGFYNYRFLFSDPLFWTAVYNTTVFAMGSLFIQLPCSLALAVLLNRKNLPGRSVFRLIFFSPSLVGLIFVGMLFTLIFDKNTGLMNVSLHRLVGWNLEFPWLERYVRPALILAAFWMYVGFNMVYFLAALQSVEPELVEAAAVDGAGPWRRFFHVTLPAIRPVGLFVVLLSLLGSFQLFELPYVLFFNSGNENGPDNQALTVVMYLYQNGFERGDLGYASAVGWVLALLLILLAVGYRMLARAEER